MHLKKYTCILQCDFSGPFYFIFFAGCNVITQESDVDMEDNKPLVVPSESEMGITIVDNDIAVTDKVGEEGSFEYLRMVSKCFLMNCNKHYNSVNFFLLVRFLL